MGPPTYPSIASMDATPMAITTGPARNVSPMPDAVATAIAVQVATHILRELTTPAATILAGPIRSPGSAPRAASETSLAKLAATWIANAPTKANENARQSKTRSWYAAADPTRTGTTPAGKVRGRAAWIHGFVWRLRSATGICGNPGPAFRGKHRAPRKLLPFHRRGGWLPRRIVVGRPDRRRSC